VGGFDEIEQPRLAFEDLLKRLIDGGPGRYLGQHFRCFIEENNFALGIERDYAIVQVGQDLFPRYLRGRLPFGRSTFFHDLGRILKPES